MKEALRIKPNFEAAMEAYQRYGYGKIHTTNKGKLVFNDYHYNNKGNHAYNKQQQSGDARNRQGGEGYYAQHHFKNTNRNGKYYVKKTPQPTNSNKHHSVEGETASNANESEKDKDDRNDTVSPARSESDTSNPITTDTDLEKEHSPESSASTAGKQHLRMYDLARRNHRFNIDEKWIDDRSAMVNYDDDKQYFVNWLKSIRLYSSNIRSVFGKNKIDTMKAFHSQVTSKQAMIDMFANYDDYDSNHKVVDILWQSAPKQSNKY